MKPLLGQTILLAAAAALCIPGASATGATITASYDAGYRDVVINGYGTSGLGTFRLEDQGDRSLALCIEAHQSHSTVPDAYTVAPNLVVSPELDVLLWRLSGRASIDDDTGAAAGALAWFYANAQRSMGVRVWSDGTDDFSAIAPLFPEPWDALPPYSLEHPIGLRASGEDLEEAERLIAQLHRSNQHLIGPWQIASDGSRFQVIGPAGPITDQMVTVAVTDHTGRVVAEQRLPTDGSGIVTPDLPILIHGGAMTASVDGPGVHREWDGPGDVQRMATGITLTSTARIDIDPPPRYLIVEKVSSDATIGVEGAVFSLTDGTGAKIGNATSDASGIARFSPFDPSLHPGPYVIVEVDAPLGLKLDPTEWTADDFSIDPEHPSKLLVENEPLTAPIRIIKQLSLAGAGPSDRSGFEFDIVRDGDDLTMTARTEANGATPAVLLPMGSYEVCERSVPAWATGFTDGGCQRFAIGLEQLTTSAAIEIEYTNIAPTVAIDTSASDGIDGDRTLPHDGGEIIDVVSLDHLVPGVSYVLNGSVMAGDKVMASASVSFVADGPSASIAVPFDVHGFAPGEYVIFERLALGDTLVAEHADPLDPDQTFTVSPPPTTTTATTTTTSTIPATTTPATTTTAVTTTAAPTTTSPVPPSTVARVTPTAPPSGPGTTTSTYPGPVPTLPATGSQDVQRLLRLGDIGFVAGVILIAATGFIPRRPTSR